MRARIALVILLATHVGILALMRYRTDLDAITFALTYWFPIATAIVMVIYLWPHTAD